MIFGFEHDHGLERGALKQLLGGKGAGLHTMTRRLGLPVPPGFTLAAPLCARFRAGEDVVAEHAGEVSEHLARVEEALGRRLGDPENPLLLSVRSGAAVSMPGMMDTVLNVGLTTAAVEGLARRTGSPRFALDSRRRFLAMYGVSVLGVEEAAVKEAAALPEDADERDLEAAVQTLGTLLEARAGGVPDDARAQLDQAIRAVFASWESPRARHYRRIEGIDADLGTAVTVQAMVFGNLDEHSGTGVAFTRDPSTGEAVPFGDFLFRAQGEDVVAGGHRTLPLADLGRELPAVWEELRRCFRVLEHHYRDLCDIEFTVESGRLWLLQTRVGKRSPLAAVRCAVEMAEDPDFPLGRAEALARVPASTVEAARAQLSELSAQAELTRGLGVSPGIATGRVVFDPDAAIVAVESGDEVILVRRETSPADVHGMQVANGILTTVGGLVSHAAVVARAWGIPAVCGASAVELTPGALRVGDVVVREGDTITLDGGTGAVLLGRAEARARSDTFVDTLAQWHSEAEAARTQLENQEGGPHGAAG